MPSEDKPRKVAEKNKEPVLVTPEISKAMDDVLKEKNKPKKRIDIPMVKCMFCDKVLPIVMCIRVGKKQVCGKCMERLGDMIEFHKRQ